MMRALYSALSLGKRYWPNWRMMAALDVCSAAASYPCTAEMPCVNHVPGSAAEPQLCKPGIHHFTLGLPFQAWLGNQARQDAASAVRYAPKK